jgi:hypothetical protein
MNCSAAEDVGFTVCAGDVDAVKGTAAKSKREPMPVTSCRGIGVARSKRYLPRLLLMGELEIMSFVFLCYLHYVVVE